MSDYTFAVTVFVLILIISIFMASGGYLYRAPALLAVVGVLIGLSGASLAYEISIVGANTKVLETYPDLLLAKDIVTVLFSSMSGSLIASALIFYCQRRHEKEIKKLKDEILKHEERVNSLEKKHIYMDNKKGKRKIKEDNEVYDLLAMEIVKLNAAKRKYDKIT